MEYPTLNVKQKDRDMIDLFLGYNHNLRIRENEFYDMKNMTSDYYPVLAPRKKRGVYREPDSNSKVLGLIAKDEICYVTHSYFVIGEEAVPMGPFGDTSKKLISMGSYVIIMPDKKWINTVKKDGEDEYEWGDIEYSEDFLGAEFYICKQTGEEYGDAQPDNKSPANPEDGTLWIDTSSVPSVLKKYSKDQSMWVSIPTTYVKIVLKSKKASMSFEKYDGVKISGITVGDANSLNGYHTVWDARLDTEPGSDGYYSHYIIVTGILDEGRAIQKEEQGVITISREMPIMDHIIECNNRLWGCRYGANADGEIVNEIYASKQGDFKNWQSFMQISTDSWVQGVGSDGPFTGAISHMGNPIFFKENCMHKVYGSIPANFQVQTTPCRGVQKGSQNSLAVVNETLFYKSVNAVCAYDGSMPVEMSSALGDVRYSNAVACAHGNKYYICMEDVAKDHHLFVYDTTKGVWHKEDNIYVDIFLPYMNEIYALEFYKENIITMLGSGNPLEEEEKVPWMVETGLIGMAMPDMKYISKLLVRMSLEEGASVKVMIQYDSIGDWERVCEMTATSLRSFSVPIRPRRCDHFRLRIEGLGDGRIYSITKTIEQGSDRS